VANLAQEFPHTGMVLQIPGRQVWWQPLDLESPGGRAHRKRPLQNAPKHGGIALRPYPHPVVQIAFGAKVLRRGKDAPSGPKRPRQRDGSVGRIAIERDLDPAAPAEQRQPRRLPAVGAVEPARASVPESGPEHRQMAVPQRPGKLRVLGPSMSARHR